MDSCLAFFRLSSLLEAFMLHLWWRIRLYTSLELCTILSVFPLLTLEHCCIFRGEYELAVSFTHVKCNLADASSFSRLSPRCSA